MAIEARWHVMVAIVRNTRYRCQRCHYVTDLSGAIEHAVANQERV